MKTTVKLFQELTNKELYECMRIRNEVFVVEQTCIYQDCDNKDQQSYHLFLEEEGQILAYARILPKGVAFEQVAIGRVLVTKENRGKGLARKVLAESIKFVEESLKESVIKIEAQAYLKNFYGSLGFVQTSEEYLEDGIPHIDMFYGEEK